MKSFEIFACALAVGCGGSLFTPDGSADAGSDVSSGGSVITAGSGTGAGSSVTSGSGSGTTVTVGTTGAGGANDTTSGVTGAGGVVGTGGFGGSSATGAGGFGGKVGAGGQAGFGGTISTGSAGGAGGGTAGRAGTGGSTGKAGAGGQGGGVDWGVCTDPTQCTPQTTGCCAPCATPELDRFAGVNAKYIDAFRSATCPVPQPCPRCASFPNPYIGARCANMRCQAFDVRNMPELSKCATNADCRLRKGLDCCECGSTGGWTAVSVTGQGALNSTVCGPMTACADCLPLPPATLTAVCVAGHCEVAGIN